jgi:hypothetical protein
VLPERAKRAFDAGHGQWPDVSTAASTAVIWTFHESTAHRSAAARSHPAAPDGIAIIGFDPDREPTCSTTSTPGVARVYEMSFSEGVWKLWRESLDLSPLDFSQRYTGTFSDDAKTITGRWETSSDGSSWEHDFDLAYTKIT